MTEELTPPPKTGRERQIEALDKHRADTQFGTAKGNENHHSRVDGANRPWSIRNSLRYLARQPIDREDPKAMQNLLPKECTLAQMIAANTLTKATKGDMRAVEYVTDQIDGKLAQTNINADFAAIQGMTDDEIDAKIAELERETAAANDADGKAAEAGGAEPSGQQE